MMPNMWNTFNNNLLFTGYNKNIVGPNFTQKRYLENDYPNVMALNAVKSFSNPNFVNRNHPKLHSYPVIHPGTSTPSCQTDNKNNIKLIHGINSSLTIFDTIKEQKLDAVQSLNKSEVKEEVFNTDCEEQSVDETSQRRMCNKRTRRKKYRSHKYPEKIIQYEMEVDIGSDNDSNSFDISMSPKEQHSLTFGSFLQDNSLKTDCETTIEAEDNADCALLKIVSSSPSNIQNGDKRERTLSVAESEDSFIVFESGSDDELEFSDNSQAEDESDDDSCEETDEDDTSPSVVPRKKVRFADDSELCHVHPMIKWSYAYQKARIGPWQKYAVDRVRFKDHIKHLEEKITPVLDSKYREQIFKTRFQDSEVLQS